MEFTILRKIIKNCVLLFALFFICRIIPWHFDRIESPTGLKDQKSERPYDEYIVYVNQIRRTIARQIFREMGLVCTGDIGQMHEKVEEIGMKFNAYRHATVEEARALHVLVLEKLAAAINADEGLRPFLIEHPFTYKQIQIGIRFEGPEGGCFEGNVARVSNVASPIEEENNLHYRSADPFAKRCTYLFKEPYKTAIEIVKCSPLQNPTVHQAKPIEEIMDGILSAFVKKMREEYGLRCYFIGGKLTDFVEEIGASFSIVQHAPQKRAKKMTVLVIENLLQEINNNEQLRPYLKDYPFSVDRVKMRIDFTKKDGYSYCDGSVKYITVKDKEICYFQIPPDPKAIEFEQIFAKEDYPQP